MSTTTNALNNSATVFDVDNLKLDGNTISSTDTDGNIVLQPDGTGKVTVDYATQYTLPVYGASGALEELSGVGTSGQVLTSNGAGSAPTFENPVGGWELITSGSAISVTE